MVCQSGRDEAPRLHAQNSWGPSGKRFGEQPFDGSLRGSPPVAASPIWWEAPNLLGFTPIGVPVVFDS